jgi:hypothetical protein
MCSLEVKNVHRLATWLLLSRSVTSIYDMFAADITLNAKLYCLQERMFLVKHAFLYTTEHIVYKLFEHSLVQTEHVYKL